MAISNTPQTPRGLAQEKFNAARANLLVMIGFTLLNVILALTGTSTMMLFSATFPYVMAVVATIADIPVLQGILLGVAIVAIVPFFLCWIFSKRRYGWLIAALVMFSLDTLFMLGFYLRAEEWSGILDVVFHIWIIIYLAQGIKYGYRLKTMPPEETPMLTQEMPDAPAQTASTQETAPLRRADTEVKHRVLLEVQASGYHISYRRVKRTNELVINGYVYGEMEMLIETPHQLCAVLGGHRIVAGYTGIHSYVQMDGTQLAKKMRL